MKKIRLALYFNGIDKERAKNIKYFCYLMLINEGYKVADDKDKEVDYCIIGHIGNKQESKINETMLQFNNPASIELEAFWDDNEERISRTTLNAHDFWITYVNPCLQTIENRCSRYLNQNYQS